MNSIFDVIAGSRPYDTSPDEKPSEFFFIRNLEFNRLKSELCDGIFLISLSEISGKLPCIDRENASRMCNNEPLVRHLNLLEPPVNVDGETLQVVHSFDFEAVRTAILKIYESRGSQFNHGVSIIDNGSLADSTLQSRLIIFDDGETSEGTLFSVLKHIDAHHYIKHVGYGDE